MVLHKLLQLHTYAYRIPYELVSQVLSTTTFSLSSRHVYYPMVQYEAQASYITGMWVN